MIPFDGLKIHDRTSTSRVPCLGFTSEEEERVYVKNLTSLLTLRHLAVNILDASENEFDCPAYKKIVAWLQNGKRGQLESLNIENGQLLIEIFGDESVPGHLEFEDESSPPEVAQSQDKPISAFP